MASGTCQSGVCDAIALQPVIRQAGGTMGPVHIRQFAFEPKTGVCLTRDRGDLFKFNNGGLFMVPEPGTMSLLGISLGLLAIWRLRRCHTYPGNSPALSRRAHYVGKKS